jgi:hypothetical protein
MAALTNLAICTLRLFGRTGITEATRWAGRSMDRPLTITASLYDLETAVMVSALANETGPQQHNDRGNAQAAGQDLGTHGESENQADAGHGSGLSSLPPPLTQESVITSPTVHLPVTQAPVRPFVTFQRSRWPGMPSHPVGVVNACCRLCRKDIAADPDC